jgi:hypothetical protein
MAVGKLGSEMGDIHPLPFAAVLPSCMHGQCDKRRWPLMIVRAIERRSVVSCFTGTGQNQ